MAFADELRDGKLNVQYAAAHEYPFEDVVDGLITAIEIICKEEASRGEKGVFIDEHKLYGVITGNNYPWFEEMCQKFGANKANRVKDIFFSFRDVCKYREHEEQLQSLLSSKLQSMGFKDFERYEYVSMYNHNGRVDLVAFHW